MRTGTLATLLTLALRTPSARSTLFPTSIATCPAAAARPLTTCTPRAQQQQQQFRMADLPADVAKEEVQRLAEPAEPCEGEILGENKVRTEALKESASAQEDAPKEEVLPKLSAADFRVYNSMAEHMEYFHNHFRQSWTLLYNACEQNRRPTSMSLKSFLNTGLQFISHLETHHGIEEAHIFPVLARKMPEFANGRNKAELLRQHQEIHKGMEVLGAYLEKCRSGETELELRVLKEKMDTWGGVLWKHLDQEVKTLGAENMRKYWSKEEMKRMPM